VAVAMAGGDGAGGGGRAGAGAGAGEPIAGGGGTGGGAPTSGNGGGGGCRAGGGEKAGGGDKAAGTGIVFRATMREPKIILSEYMSKKRDIKKPKYTAKQEAGGQGWVCKVVLPDKYKPDNDVVIHMNDAATTKDEAIQRAAVYRQSLNPGTLNS